MCRSEYTDDVTRGKLRACYVRYRNREHIAGSFLSGLANYRQLLDSRVARDTLIFPFSGEA